MKHTPKPGPAPRFVDAAYIAKDLNLALRTLQNWRQRRVGPPHVRIGGRVRYPFAEYEAWCSTRTRK